MTNIVTMRFGSHLYGTDTPKSDNDYKAVFVPPARDILLQRVQATMSNRRPKVEGEKNVAGDEDLESFAWHQYLRLLGEGQTIALDMLFAPESMMLAPPDPIWYHLIDNRDRLINRKATSFIGYCRTQANKYGIKGSRVAAVRAIVEWFDSAIAKYGHLTRLGEAAFHDKLQDLVNTLEHTEIIDLVNHGQLHPHLVCCGRKVPYQRSLKDCRAPFAKIFEEYGGRALLAEKNEGIDWKALSHAVRVGYEALELLKFHWITFPLLRADHIKRIKLGELPYAEVAEEIEDLLERVEEASRKSSLRDEPDYAFIDDLVVEVYRREM